MGGSTSAVFRLLLEVEEEFGIVVVAAGAVEDVGVDVVADVVVDVAGFGAADALWAVSQVGRRPRKAFAVLLDEAICARAAGGRTAGRGSSGDLGVAVAAAGIAGGGAMARRMVRKPRKRSYRRLVVLYHARCLVRLVGCQGLSKSLILSMSSMSPWGRRDPRNAKS